MEEGVFICHSCGKRVRCTLERPPCEALAGWLMLVQWRGRESVDHLAFCSFTCLQRWVNTKVPEIPQTFLKSFGEENINCE
jgi:hypothetical protein